ncbi:DUF6790 family protein [Acuticoccus mangrovi]|uniref:Uncharacterized protein n=1 Tax=Acuticoccus mangrovi TaxID=2796142 RepID=A0A934IPQ8_9HYPH|nr:DUF6790 family protein [Acuticoccus mangrovi]MBJ3776333.1 hypothetical protein [Acuticoccus mangrovi]
MAFVPLVLYVIALVLGIAGVGLPGQGADLSPLAAWMLLVSLGLNSLWAALGHLMKSEEVAASIGWATSPFQKEVGAANLGIGLAAVAAAFLGAGAGWAVFLVAAGFLWGAATVHLLDMVRARNFAINNAGPIFWWDILTPLTILIALL